MYPFWTSVMAFCCLVVLLLVSRQRYKRSIELKQQQGLAYIKNLRLILALLQKHRGLTSTYIKGEVSLKTSIMSLQHEANRRIKDFVLVSRGIQENELWLGILDHWSRLTKSYVSNNVENNLTQHNAMIQNMLYLIDDMAVSHEVTRLKINRIGNIRLVWKELLTAIECLGQARAMGSAILAEGTCSSVSRIRLAYLQQKISATADNAWRGIPFTEAQKRQLDKVVHCIKNEIIGSSNTHKTTLGSKDYFNMCSEVMDNYYQHFDNLFEQL